MKVYQKIASTVEALKYCYTEDDTSKYRQAIDNHETTIEYIEKNVLPHGSGIDGETEIDVDKSKPNKLYLHSSYHAMEDGYYTRWIDYIVRIAPAWNDIDLLITGNFGRDQDIKESLYDLYHMALTEDLTPADEVTLKELWK